MNLRGATRLHHFGVGYEWVFTRRREPLNITCLKKRHLQEVGVQKATRYDSSISVLDIDIKPYVTDRSLFFERRQMKGLSGDRHFEYISRSTDRGATIRVLGNDAVGKIKCVKNCSE